MAASVLPRRSTIRVRAGSKSAPRQMAFGLTSVGVLALVLWGLSGCKEKPWPDGPASSVDEQMAEQIWQSRCVDCHGKTGRGDGPLSASLTTKSRDFSDPVWQRDEEDDELEAVILLGGQAMGYSAEMPASPDLNKHPAVAPLLVKKIRSFNRER